MLKKTAKRALPAKEIGDLLRDFEGHGGNFQMIAAFNLMWYTLCRPNESVEAEWKEFDLDNALWRLPPERMKKEKERLIPPLGASSRIAARYAWETAQARIPKSRRPYQANGLGVATTSPQEDGMGW
jgi:integrase